MLWGGYHGKCMKCCGIPWLLLQIKTDLLLMVENYLINLGKG